MCSVGVSDVQCGCVYEHLYVMYLCLCARVFQGICSDPVMHERVLKSYELMLDFYGMKLKDGKTGL